MDGRLRLLLWIKATPSPPGDRDVTSRVARSLRHARAQRAFGSMQQDGDVARGDTEGFGDVFSGALFEHAQGDDGALDFAELGDARAQTDVILGAREEILLEDD